MTGKTMKEKPKTSAQRQEKRREKLKKLAELHGLESWSTLETRLLAGEYEIIKNKP